MSDTWTAVLAIATVMLAGATVYLGLEARLSRREARRDAVARAIRAAVREQLDNLRAWHSLEPARVGWEGMPALLAATPTFERVTALVDSVDLPTDLAIYIIWLVGDTGRVLDDLSESFRPFAGLVDHGGGGTNFASTRIPADWSVVLDRLQVLLCLLQAEAGRRRMGPLAELGFDVSWTRPRVKPDGIRLGNRVADQVYFAAPTFPRGSAHARCDVGPREQEAARIAAAERASLVAGPSGQSP